MGAEAFAGRARRELLATGETAGKRTVQTVRTRSGEAGDALTVREAQIARMARDGLPNSEVGARLFISTRTVQHHLRKVFTILGISSRGQLYRVLPNGAAAVQPKLARPHDGSRLFIACPVTGNGPQSSRAAGALLGFDRLDELAKARGKRV
jgi:DNA-binding CsgD family transcriptional regulator